MSDYLPASDLEIRRQQWWSAVAHSRAQHANRPSAHVRALVQIFRKLVPESSRVLQLGCGTGEILDAVRPSMGVGVESSRECVDAANLRHGAKSHDAAQRLEFIAANPETFVRQDDFDYVIASDLLIDCFDVDDLLASIRRCCNRDTRVIVTNYSQAWRPILKVAQALGLARPRFGSTWFSPADVRAALERAGFELIQDLPETLVPIRVPLVSALANRLLARLPVMRALCLHRVVVARIAPMPRTSPASVSVIVPARNEAGNIERILSEMPKMGSWTEVVFVEGNSTDDTWSVLERVVRERNDPNIRLLKQPGKGKGDAVRHGFAAARGDILMILDADLTVPAEMLPRFYDAVCSGHAEFANGTRLVYRMDARAMQFLNLLANHFFARAFTYVLGQPVRDTLCGTKVVSRTHYDQIARNRQYFGDFDPFGDFDLLFGAARLNLRIRDIPIRYRERTYGQTNISRFRHGILLFRMLGIAAVKLKFR